MAEIDVGQEWRRLHDLYAGMTEEELEAVAAEGYDLTDIAKQALNSEISRRGLNMIVRLAPPEDEEELPGDHDFDPATLDLTDGCLVENHEQAEGVKKTLNDAGIPCYFGPDLLENVERLQFTEGHPVEVKILTSDSGRVIQLLKDFQSKLLLMDDGESDVEVHCPKCNSTEVVFLGFDSAAQQQGGRSEDSEGPDSEEGTEDAEEDDSEEMFGAHAPDAKFNWSCDACGYQWADDGVET